MKLDIEAGGEHILFYCRHTIYRMNDAINIFRSQNIKTKWILYFNVF